MPANFNEEVELLHRSLEVVKDRCPVLTAEVIDSEVELRTCVIWVIQLTDTSRA